MSSPAPASAPASPPTAPPGRSSFLIVIVVVAIVIAAAVGYLGLTDRLGGGIPGTKPGSDGGNPPATSCEGKGASGNVYLGFVAGASPINQGINFNGTVPGPCVLVGVGAAVTVNFTVARSDGGMNHSWVLVPEDTNGSSPAVFPGAGSPGAGGNGFAPGTSTIFHFTAAIAGDYRYICEMPGHYQAGMWGWFNVTASGG
jgi:plastocyanin